MNYCNVNDNGTLRFIPDDSPILDSHPIDIPALNHVAQNCEALMPAQSCKLIQQGLSILHLNARSLHQSFHEIVTLVVNNSHTAHFILVSETWLDDCLLSGYEIPGYEMIHSIPECSFIGKGCAMYIRQDIFPFCKKLDGLCAKQNEYQCIIVQVNYPQQPGFLVGVTYRSPSYPFALFLPYIENTLNVINNLQKACFWGGDWNLNLFQYHTKSDVKTFIDCLNSFGFFPTITIPTRIATSPPYSQTLIDNIFTNSLDSILQSCTICCGIADHQAVLCTTSIFCPSNCRDKIPATKKINFACIDDVKTNLSEKLTSFYNICDPELACNVLISAIQKELDDFSSVAKHRRHTPIQPWVTPAIIRSINKRNKLLKEFLRNRSAEKESKFKKYRNILRLTLRNAKKRYFQNQFDKHMNNPRLLWENLLQATNKQKVKPRPVSRFEVDGDFVTDQRVITESFNTYYSNVAPNLEAALGPSDADPLSYMHDVEVPEMMVFEPVTEQEIFLIVMKLKETGAGCDQINAKLLKLILPSILPQLKHLINLCVNKCTFPSSLKMAVITPVYKGGSKTMFSSYRPISVLPVISKVLETIMYNQLMMFITKNNILYDNQFGFRAMHSTYMPISILHDFITDNLTQRRKSAGIFLDLARAFDTVNINILLQKLNAYNISGNALSFLTSYLTNRTQRVKFNGIISGTKDVICGVPQGSVLGPLLFLLYVNDLHKVCQAAKFLLFADDTAILYSASSKNELQSIIGESFPKIRSWLIANRLSLSVPKTFYQLYSNDDADHTLHISVGNTCLKRAETVKYLGVLIDDDLKFKSHVNKVSGVISRQIGVIGRARYLLNTKLMTLLYNALILPYLTYCSSVWGSNYATTLQSVVIAQKRAIRMIAGVPAGTHTSALFHDLKIMKFTELVQSQMLYVLHNYITGKLPRVIAERFELNVSSRETRAIQHFSERTRSYLTGQIIPNYRLYNYHQFTLFCRAPSLWNNIVANNIPNIKDVPLSKTFFKKVIKKILTASY